jgi:hypothetical protein
MSPCRAVAPRTETTFDRPALLRRIGGDEALLRI